MTYKSILCLNGELPPRDFFEKFSLPIVAADGAANKLHALGITPRVVIGDLDSVAPHLGVERIHVEDQNRCDYEKAMDYLVDQKLLPTVVLGSSGGDLDHILNNINVFMQHSPGNLLYAAPLYGTVLSQPQTRLTLPTQTKISMIGLPEVHLVTQGLKWDLTGQKLSFPGFNSCFNRTNEKTINIQIIEGQVLFLAHAFFLQETL